MIKSKNINIENYFETENMLSVFNEYKYNFVDNKLDNLTTIQYGIIALIVAPEDAVVHYSRVFSTLSSMNGEELKLEFNQLSCEIKDLFAFEYKMWLNMFKTTFNDKLSNLEFDTINRLLNLI